MSAPRSMFEYMGNKKWRQEKALEAESGQGALPGIPESPAEALDLDERYTTRETLAWCAQKAGVVMFDVDVAACEESHKADIFYTKEANGLALPWRGRVWCNPPFSDIEPWVRGAWIEMQDRRAEVVAMLLPATRTEQPWWQELVECARDGRKTLGAMGVTLETHFLPGRTRFGLPGNPDGIGVGSPPFGCVLLVWRRA